jgi:hypothetical protein
MKTKKSLFVFAAAALLVGATSLRAQQTAPPAQQPQQQQQQATITTGELVRVDATAKTVEVKPATGASMVFKYTDDTKVTGADKGTAGLATMAGSRVSVHHMRKGEDDVATEIEVIEAKK